MRSPFRRVFRFVLFVAALLVCAACGGGAPRSQVADLLAVSQPPPDPTLDPVVRDLPRSLAGVPPTPTPTARPTVAVPAPAKPVVKSAPTARPGPPTPPPPTTQPPGRAAPPPPPPPPPPLRGSPRWQAGCKRHTYT